VTISTVSPAQLTPERARAWGIRSDLSGEASPWPRWDRTASRAPAPLPYGDGELPAPHTWSLADYGRSPGV